MALASSVNCRPWPAVSIRDLHRPHSGRSQPRWPVRRRLRAGSTTLSPTWFAEPAERARNSRHTRTSVPEVRHDCKLFCLTLYVDKSHYKSLYIGKLYTAPVSRLCSISLFAHSLTVTRIYTCCTRRCMSLECSYQIEGRLCSALTARMTQCVARSPRALLRLEASAVRVGVQQNIAPTARNKCIYDHSSANACGKLSRE